MMNLPRGFRALTIEDASLPQEEDASSNIDESAFGNETPSKRKSVSNASAPFWPPVLTHLSLPLSDSFTAACLPHLSRNLDRLMIGSQDATWWTR